MANESTRIEVDGELIEAMGNDKEFIRQEVNAFMSEAELPKAGSGERLVVTFTVEKAE